MSDTEWIDDEEVVGGDETVTPVPLAKPLRRRGRSRIHFFGRRGKDALGAWSAAKFKTETVGLVKPSAKQAWRHVFKSDFIDLALVFSMWAALGGVVYVLNVEVPQPYHDAMWVGIALFSLPMGMFTGMHVYELYTLRQVSQRGARKVLVE